VRVINHSGQPLHLGADDSWLTFTVESTDGAVVTKTGNPAVTGEFVVHNGEMGTKPVDLAPCFRLTHEGSYQVTATVRLKDWNQELASAPKQFDVIKGLSIWSQNFGVPSAASNQAPEIRKYSLQQANFSQRQRMYVQVSDESEYHVFKVLSLGQFVSFTPPEAQLDRMSRLHVLQQSGASVFTYSVINPDGDLLQQDLYDYRSNGSRPRLRADETGNVAVFGGDRRIRAEDLPVVVPPTEAMLPAKH